MKSVVSYLAIFLTAYIFLSCMTTSKPATKADLSQTQAQEPQAAVKQTWEIEWDKLVKEAQKEGRVVVYSSAPVQDTLRSAFTQRFKIQYEGTLIRGGELSQKLLTERRAGIYTTDIYIGGTSTIVGSVKPAGAVDPVDSILILPEVLDPGAWYDGKLPFVDAQKTTFAFMASPFANIIINNQAIRPGEVKGYRDFLNPRWKGKIVMNDPTIVGAGNSTFRHVGWLILNLDYWREFVKQEPVLTRDQRLQVEWVAQGKYPIALSAQGAIVNEFRSAGAPVEYVLAEEGVYLSTSSGNLSLVNKAPHPNAAKLFANWLLSREGQRIFSHAFGAQSARGDISTEGIPADRIRQPGVKYVTGGLTEEWELLANEQTKFAVEIFAPLLKR